MKAFLAFLLTLGAQISLSQTPQEEAEIKTTLNRARVLYQQGKYPEAEQEMRAVLALRMRVFGPDHFPGRKIR
jgi:hypothetical protein